MAKTSTQEEMTSACTASSIELAAEIKKLEANIAKLMQMKPNWAVYGSLQHISGTIASLNGGFEK